MNKLILLFTGIIVWCVAWSWINNNWLTASLASISIIFSFYGIAKIKEEEELKNG